ncbi:MAG: DEAD/DEAH box helicase [bacterium]|nr:DEAD/DEAH box helicase [bacterium]
MLSIEQLTTRLLEEPPSGSHVHSHLILPPTAPSSRQATLWQLPDWLATLLQVQGIEYLSDDQYQVLRLIQQQQNICVSAPSGSGRGTVHLLALYQTLNHNQQRHALCISLQKQGELAQLRRITICNDALPPERHLRASIYDGDTPKTQRRSIKQTPPHVLLTTPEMLHTGILAYHGGWRAFLQSLGIIILPDLHLYTGAIGVHLAHLLRRLYRLCRHYGSHPQFFITTAPLGNLQRLTQDLTGQYCTIVTGEARRRYPQSRVILNVTSNTAAVTDEVATRLTEAGLAPNILEPNAQQTLSPEPQPRSVVFLGLPTSLMMLHEHLARLASAASPSLSILILCGQTPLERYVMRYPAVYQNSWQVDLPLLFDHPLLAQQHLLCAAAELALQAGERYSGLRSLSNLIKQLATEHRISRKTATRQWIATQPQPHRRLRLRFFEPAFAVIRQPDRRFISSLEPERAFREAFEGAIYRYKDESFQVERYLKDQRRIEVRSAPNAEQTRAWIIAEVNDKHIEASLSTSTYRVTYGALTYCESIHAFERLTKKNPLYTSRYVLPHHQRQFRTQAIWFDFHHNEAVAKREYWTAVHTFVHAVLASVRLIVACNDTGYTGTVCQDNEAAITRLSAMIIDLQNGGNGISACLYQAQNRLLRAALQTLLQCDCEQGCRRCVIEQRCDACEDTVALDRQAGIRLVQKMIEEMVPSLDSVRPQVEPVAEYDG